MALQSTQPLIEMGTRNISWGLRQPVCRLSTLPPLCAYCFETWVPQTLETLRACPSLYMDYFKAAGTLSWPLIITESRGLAWVELYIYSFFVPSWCGQEQLDLALRLLVLSVAVLQSRRPLFNPRPIRVWFVREKVALLPPLVHIIPPVHRTYRFICLRLSELSSWR